MKATLMTLSFLIIFSEITLVIVYYESFIHLLKTYFWLTPIVFLKSILKKLFLLNAYGLLKVFGLLLYHLGKLGLIKTLKTIGLRYATFFSQQRWQWVDQKTVELGQYITRQHQQFNAKLTEFSKPQLSLILIAFFPIVILLLLLGISFKMTRETLVKTGSEIGVSTAAKSTAKKSRSLVSWVKSLDERVLNYIQQSTEKPP